LLQALIQKLRLSEELLLHLHELRYQDVGGSRRGVFLAQHMFYLFHGRA